MGGDDAVGRSHTSQTYSPKPRAHAHTRIPTPFSCVKRNQPCLAKGKSAADLARHKAEARNPLKAAMTFLSREECRAAYGAAMRGLLQEGVIDRDRVVRQM